MFKNALYNQFGKDLLQLYCKVKDPVLEDAFIRFASEVSFPQWLRHNKKEILSKIGNSSVYDAFDILADMQGSDFGSDPDVPGKGASLGDLWKRFQASSNSMRAIPVIQTFSSLIDNPSFKNILEPFKSSVLFISKWLKEPSNLTEIEKTRKKEDDQRVAEDLRIINNMFVTQGSEEAPRVRVPSVKQQRKDMFVYLLTRFSEEIASAFENAGLEEEAKKFRSKVLAIGLREGVGSIINLHMLSFGQNNVIKYMVDYAWKRPDIRWGNYNHDLIEVTFLAQAGEISAEDLAFIRSEYEKNKDVMGIFEDKEEPIKGMDTFDKITIDKKMNPLYIQMLAVFFYYFQSKMKV